MGTTCIRAWLCDCVIQSRGSIPHGQGLSAVPELPDLTVVAEELAARLSGRRVSDVAAPTPILVRATPRELGTLIGMTVGTAWRRGKFLLLPFEGRQAGRTLAANPMLAGRFWLLADGGAKVRARTGLLIRFAYRSERRYV